MLSILILAIARLVDPVITAAADMSSCGQLSGLSAVRVHSAAVRKGRAEPDQNSDNRRSPT
jgi:hypothetical protein